MHPVVRIVVLTGAVWFGVGADDDAESSLEDLADALVDFYSAVGQPEKAPSKFAATVLLEMPKWKGREMKMFQNIQKKYADEDADAVKKLEAAFNRFAKTESERLQVKLARLRLQKEVLEGVTQLTSLVSTLETIGRETLSHAVEFNDLRLSTEEGNRLLERIEKENTWEKKLKLVKQGLSKRTEWIEHLKMVKDTLSAAEEEVKHENQTVKANESDEPVKHEMDDPEVMERAAKIMVQAVREGKIDTVVTMMGALENKPEILAKLVMWADERTGANLLHWCGFWGQEVHIKLAQTFMMVPGVNASVVDKHQHSPCHTACMKNAPDVLDQLITQHTKSGATPCDPFALGSGFNCLHLAAQRTFTKIIELLAPRLTTDILKMVTNKGATARSLALESGAIEAVNILDQAGNKSRSRILDEL